MPHTQTFSAGNVQRIFVSIDATRRCQLACRYCYFSGKSSGDMDVQRVERGLRNLVAVFPRVNALQLCFMGGEPLLAWEKIVDLIAKARAFCEDRGIRLFWGLMSNLIALDDRKAEFMIGEHAWIHCSIDGPADLHNANRPFQSGRNSFDFVRRNVQRALGITPNDVASVTVCPDGAGRCAEISRFVLDLGFKYVAPRRATGTEVTWSEESTAAFVHSLADAYRASPTYPNRRRAVQILSKKYTKPRPQFEYCHGGKTQWAIDVDGHLYDCHHLTGMRDLSIVDLAEPPERIAQAISERSLSPHRGCAPIPPRCRQCSALDFCNGGCWAVNYLANHDSRIPDSASCRARVGLVEELGSLLTKDETPRAPAQTPAGRERKTETAEWVPSQPEASPALNPRAGVPDSTGW
jgi:uncharacterized protein